MSSDSDTPSQIWEEELEVSRERKTLDNKSKGNALSTAFWKIYIFFYLWFRTPAFCHEIQTSFHFLAFFCMKTSRHISQTAVKFKMALWVRDNRKWPPEHYWHLRESEAPPTSSFPGWKPISFLRVGPRLLDKLISGWPLLAAPLMQRVLNDLVLSEELKSQIPTETISVQLALWWTVGYCWYTAGWHNNVSTC